MKSILFLPADRLERFEKAVYSGSDCVVLDLEDGVAPHNREEARTALIAAGEKLSGRQWDKFTGSIGLRISSLTSLDGLRDMLMLSELSHLPDWLFLPKVEDPRDIEQITDLLQAISPDRRPKLFAILETAKGLAKADAIVGTKAPIDALGFGFADYTAETGGTMDWTSLIWPRGQIINAAATRQLAVYDGVWLQMDDQEGLRAECQAARAMGFHGKICIHPKQIPDVNACFSPSAIELDWAKGLLAARDEAERLKQGVFVYKGKMVDSPVIRRAERILSLQPST
jgi:citrate lyase subunit beta/citryl-CoA lyase/(S)-citramalyl-CoA lyase